MGSSGQRQLTKNKSKSHRTRESDSVCETKIDRYQEVEEV